jgi:hypothetical protein
MSIMSKNGSILVRPSGGILATDCGGAAPSGSCQGCAENCVGGDLTLTISGFVDGVPYSSTECSALNGSWSVPYEPLSYNGVVYAPCRWYLHEETSVKVDIAIECDAYVAYPNEWTITINIYELGTWPYGGWRIALASTWYKNCGGKTGPVLLNCSGDHPTGSGPIFSGDGGTWVGGRCQDQTGTFTIS